MSITARLPATTHRVERHTSPHINEVIRRRSDAEILRLQEAAEPEVRQRMQVLESEWDVERLLQTNASAVVLLGMTLAATVSRKFLILPAGVFSFFAQHALLGWCPPISLFRRMGVRTQREIERERHASKALRGDFDTLPPQDAPVGERVRAVLAAVDRS